MYNDTRNQVNFMPQMESLDDIKKDVHLFKLAEAFSKEA